MERVLETHFPTWPTRVKSTVTDSMLRETLVGNGVVIGYEHHDGTLLVRDREGASSLARAGATWRTRRRATVLYIQYSLAQVLCPQS